MAQQEPWFAKAWPWREHPVVRFLAPLATELGVVLPLSIYEREGPHYFNSLVMVDADGKCTVEGLPEGIELVNRPRNPLTAA